VTAALLPTFDDVRAAARRLNGVVHRTPVVTSRTLDELAGARVFLKCENAQRMGAFKFRGAYNRLAQLSAAERACGAVAWSSGNHAQGVALAGKLLGIATTIVMPKDAPPNKIAAARGYGAEIVFYDRAGGEDRETIAHALTKARGAVMVPPFDDPLVIAGQGTLALELLEDAHLDAIVGPVGGGGMLSGVCLAAHGIDPKIDIYGVEPLAGNDFALSLERGERVSVPLPDTIADGLMTQTPGELTFAILREHAAGALTVSDDELREAMRFAFERMKLVVEPSGAAALAAVLSKKLPKDYDRIGVIITGGNVDARSFARLMSEE
jgi:threonine dehydratase